MKELESDFPSWLPVLNRSVHIRVERNLNELTAEIVAELRDARIQQQKRQQDIADAIGIGRTSVTNIEARRQKLTLPMLMAIADCLDLDVDIKLTPRG